MGKFIRFVGGPPGTGKSSYSKGIVQEVQKFAEMPVCILDGDMFYSPMRRILDSERSGIPLDTPEFAREFNLPAQLKFQRIIRSVADQRLLVIATAPFENMYGEVLGQPLWSKMKTQDFSDYDIGLSYVLLTGDEQKVENEIKRRLLGRGIHSRDVYQAKLDEPKIADPAYYSKRAALVRKSVETFGFPLVEAAIDEDPQSVSIRIAKKIVDSLG
jgi:hypothetical protein